MHRRLLLTALSFIELAACTPSRAPTAAMQRTIVFFMADSAGLDEDAKHVIRQAAETAQSSPLAPVRVLGFAAPDTGTSAFNQVLAQARAQNVADGLVAAGVARERVHVQSRGAVPFKQISTESRRVEIVIDN